MAYDYWADYEKHFKALQHAQKVFEKDFADLATRQGIYQTGQKSKDLRLATKARTDYFAYLKAVEAERISVEKLAQSSIKKLNLHIRHVKRFSESTQHFNNLNAVIRDMESKRQTISHARNQAMGL